MSDLLIDVLQEKTPLTYTEYHSFGFRWFYFNSVRMTPKIHEAPLEIMEGIFRAFLNKNGLFIMISPVPLAKKYIVTIVSENQNIKSPDDRKICNSPIAALEAGIRFCFELLEYEKRVTSRKPLTAAGDDE